MQAYNGNGKSKERFNEVLGQESKSHLERYQNYS